MTMMRLDWRCSANSTASSPLSAAGRWCSYLRPTWLRALHTLLYFILFFLLYILYLIEGLTYFDLHTLLYELQLYSSYLWVYSAYLPSFNMTSQLCWETIERPQIFCPTWWRACWTSASSKNGQDEVLQLSSSACGIVDASTYLKHWPLLLVSRAQYLVGLTIVCSQCSFKL